MSGAIVELDIYLPQIKLAFEYQGEQHFYDIHFLGSKWSQQQRDNEKKQLCIENGITLIEVPYWWDFEKESLMGTIYKQRPELFLKPVEAQPIPNQPPNGFPKGLHIKLINPLIEPVANLMHGEQWDGIQDLTEWYV
jgi:hypothetical protein